MYGVFSLVMFIIRMVIVAGIFVIVYSDIVTVHGM
jgi:hypothetical protein